jgi:hypothetical protein
MVPPKFLLTTNVQNLEKLLSEIGLETSL